MTQTTEFDLVITGGGTIGCCLALSLAQSGLRIAIVEAVDFNREGEHPGFDGRAIALARQSKTLLDSYGLQSSLTQVLTAIEHIHVSDRGYLGQCQMHHHEFQAKALGYVVELQDMGQVLHQALAASQVQWFCPNKLQRLKQYQDRVELELDDGFMLNTRLLVAADGGQSVTRKLLNIEQQIEDYQQVALIANIGLEKSHQHWAFERFTDTGPLALLPMSDWGGMARSSLVWTLKPHEVEAYLSMSEPEFLHALQQAFGYRLGRLIHCGQRFSYPLKLMRLQQQIHHRVAIIGNASHSIHPIAGQGFNLGLRDVEVLRQLILEAQQQDADIGDYSLLHRYQNLRQKDQDTVIAMTDGLVRLFSNQHWPLVAGRNLGLVAMQACSSAKSLLARQAMGHRVENING